MTVKFRIMEVRFDTDKGMVEHAFPGDLTVLAGQTGVGKTTLLELVKFGLGGNGRLAPVARQHIAQVQLSIWIGEQRLQLSRALDPQRQDVVRVVDLVTGDQMPDHHVGGDERTVSDLLLTAMGLEAGLRAAARSGRGKSAGAEITFNDVFRFMYVPQAEMNRDIAFSQQGYYDPKRKSVFELLFGITSSSILQMRSEVNTLKNEIMNADQEAEAVKRFLKDTGLTSRTDAETRQEHAFQKEARARATLGDLQGELAEVSDRQAQVLRDLLNDAERSLAEARSLAAQLAQQETEYEMEHSRVALEIDRLIRMEAAGLRLASIEFSLCPRCTQRLDQREAPLGTCPVCLQEDVVSGAPIGGNYETEQLRSQLAEIDEQRCAIRQQGHLTDTAIQHRASLVASLTAEIDERTGSIVTPRLQAYADAAAELASASAEQHALEQVLRQWDRADDLTAMATQFKTRRVDLQSRLRTAEADLESRKVELFIELDAEFQATVTEFGIPSITTATISSDTYLPVLNGQPFTEVSSGGGIITAAQVAYWIALVTVAARRRDTHFPAFLLLDSPRLALNSEDDIAAQMYRRFAIQVAVTPGRLQFIVADNEPPGNIDAGTFTEMSFSYETPTVATIEHPGPAGVKTLDDEPPVLE